VGRVLPTLPQAVVAQLHGQEEGDDVNLLTLEKALVRGGLSDY
jgi:hypothetical protein